MIKNATGIIGRDAGGMLKCLVMLVSMVEPWWTEKVWSCAKQRVIMIEQQNIGSMLRMILAFSTCVTLHSFHGFDASCFSSCTSDFLWIAALSKNLCRRMLKLNACTYISLTLVTSEIEPENISMRLILYFHCSFFVLFNLIQFHRIFRKGKVSVANSCYVDLENGSQVFKTNSLINAKNDQSLKY